MNAEQTTEVQETQTVAEAKSKLSKANKGEPLIKGFRDDTVILPLAILQRNLQDTTQGLSNALQEIQQANMQSLQYVLQITGNLTNQLEGARRTISAVARLAGVQQEALDAEIKKIVAEEAAANEKAQDEKQGRVTVDRESKEGDTVKISYVGSIGGEVFPGGSAENYHLTLGSNTFIPGFESQLVGKKAGETVNVTVTFPNNYGNKQLAGKEAVFQTTVQAVKEIKDVEENLAESAE